MTTKDDFTQEEWAILSKTLHEPSVAIMVASPGGGLPELFATLQGPLEAAKMFAESELIQSLLTDFNSMSETDTPPKRPESLQEFQDQVMAEMIAHLRRAVKTLMEKATPQELDDYKQLMMFLAEKTAKAAREGGLLSGESVTQDEQRVLDEIKLALHRKV